MRRKTTIGVLGGVVALAAGCSPASLLNPQFTAALGYGGQSASLPRENPALLLGVRNDTANVVEAQLSWRDGAGNTATRVLVMNPGDNPIEAVICPVSSVTLGDIGNLQAVGAVVFLGNGGASDPFIQVEPFGTALDVGINYDCGDEIEFSVTTSGATASGYQIIAFIRREHAQ